MAESGHVQTRGSAVRPRPERRRRRRVKRLLPYNVVLLDDDYHTYEYVIEMLQSLFGYSRQRAYQMAREVDTTGRVVVYTAHRELAELKRDQIHAWGRDWRISSCKGSMSAIIEPAN